MLKQKWLMCAGILVLLLGVHVRGQNSTIIAYGFTAPVLGLPGTTVSVCALDWMTAPIYSGPVTVSEQIIDVPLGVPIATQYITLPISALAPNQPTVCVKHKIPDAAVSPAGAGELVAGAVILYPASSDQASVPALFSASLNVAGASVQTVPIPLQTIAVSSGSAIRGPRGLSNSFPQ